MLSEIIFRRGKESDAGEIGQLARKIWNQAYASIISQAQIDFMLEQGYERSRLKRELREGPEYWLLAIQRNTLIGFSSWSVEAGKAKLHKLYLDPDFHHQGLGSQLLRRVENLIFSEGLPEIHLQVNKQNRRAIRCYERNGYTKIQSIVIPIGNGFVMDDYIFSKTGDEK